jgi:hypothetical protein
VVGDAVTLALAGTCGSSSPASVSTNATGVATFTYTASKTAGICTVTATEAAQLVSGTTTVDQTPVTPVSPLPQTISFTSTAPTNAVVGGATYTPTATATSGLTVTLTIDSTSSAVCSMSAGVVSFTAVGTCKIDANQVGSANYNAAPQVQQPVTVGKGSQTISFNAPSSGTVTGSDLLAPTASSGLTVALTVDASTTNNACSLSVDTVNYLNAGSCVLDANQAGSADYGAATQVQKTFTVGPLWSSTSIDSGVALDSVSCTSDIFCMAVDYNGYALSYDGTTWTSPSQIDPNEGLNSVSCASSTFCMAVDYTGNADNVLTYDGSGWSVTSGGPAEGLSGVSCTSDTFCMVTAYTSDAQSYNGSTWSSLTNTDPLATGYWAIVSCSSSSFCMLVDDPGDAAVYDSSGWSAAANIDSSVFDSVSCPNSSFCMAVDGAGNALTYWNPKTQTITMAATGSARFDQSGVYNVTASSNDTTATLVYTVDGTATDSAGCSVDSTGVVSFTGPGVCTIDVNSGLDGTYGAAAQAQQTITVSAG